MKDRNSKDFRAPRPSSAAQKFILCFLVAAGAVVVGIIIGAAIELYFPHWGL